MPRSNLSSMDVQELLNLRKRVDATLAQRRTDLEKELQQLDGGSVRVRGGRGTSPLAGKRVAPKYRGPGGVTWAGRGATPRWLVAAMKQGKKLDDFLIEKSAQRGRRKRRAKR